MSKNLIIVISSSPPGGLEAQVDGRFGRCQYFTFVKVENDDIKLLEIAQNPGVSAMGGAGMQAAQFVGNKKADAVITGNLGPNAFTALSSLGMKMIVGAMGITVKEAVKRFLDGSLKETDTATVQSHYGMGGGRGMGGGGRGMGGGRGQF
ncbi:MAG: dinitrogenase iron-molybdenum cofactor biosynthesis protein [Candidatus Lokiarchaeota archaeon]|nr:dinitrogenase iron-molybdenum cofactor biosynthesis protein [Candidatus Lokiarchaeota archaeon]